MASQGLPRTGQTNTLNTYFQSPIDTLLDSAEDNLMEKISMHDLTQAYGLFSARVKAFSEAACDDAHRSDTITYLQDNSSVVSRCLIRDIRRVVTPLQSTDDDTALSDKALKDQLHEARDNSVLAQNALALLAQVFSLHDCPHILTNTNISRLLECILDVLDEPWILAPGERKIRSLAVWALSAFRASSMVLEDLAMDILHFLVNLMRKKQETELVLCDALKVLHNVLIACPKRYLPSSLGLLEHVLGHLVSPSIQSRKYAALALVGYAQALLAHSVPTSSDDPSYRNNLSTRICEFVEEQVAARKRSCQSREEFSGEIPDNLVDIIRAEIPQDGMSPPGSHIGWAFSVLHALVILSDGKLYGRSAFLKFVMKIIHPCLVHTWEPLLILHSGVWRALVWAFTRVPRIDDIEDSQGMPSSHLNGANRREAVLKTIRQLPEYNVGSTVVYVLMGPGKSVLHVSTDAEVTEESQDDDDVIQAISIIKQLVEDSVKEKRIEGIGLMAACTNNEVDTNICGPFDTRRILLDVMSDFDLIDAEHGHVEALTKGMNSFAPDAMRIFTDEELVTYWHLLVDVWDEAVREAIQLGGRRALDIESRLNRTWQGLLRGQQRFSDLPNDEVAVRAAKVIIAYLDWTPSCPVIDVPFRGCIVTTRMKTIRQLILGAKRVLSKDVLGAMSRRILYRFLEADVQPRGDELKSLWVEVCSELCACGGTFGLAVHPQAVGFEKRRDQWYALLQVWPTVDTPQSWEAAVAFCSIPFPHWAMTNGEEDCWIELFESALTNAEQSGVRSNQVLEMLCRYIPATSPPFEYRIILKLVPKLSLTVNDMIPTKFLTRINEYLCHQYPPPLNQVHRIEKVIRVLSAKLACCSGTLIVPFVMQLQEGIGQWLQDKDHLSKQERYADFILPFYYNAVSTLRSAPFRVEDIQGLDTFLAAPFLRSKYSEKTLRCLNEYWEAIEDPWYKLLGDKPPPPGIEKWVVACHYACHTRPPRFMAGSSSSSQSETSMNTVPDSQPLEDEAASDDLHEESITPKAHKTLLASLQDNRESRLVSRVAAQAPTPVAPLLRAPIALASSKNTHPALAESSLANSTRLQQATKPTSASRKRRRADAEDFVHHRQRKRTAKTDQAITMSSEDVPAKSRTRRVCGSRASPVRLRNNAEIRNSNTSQRRFAYYASVVQACQQRKLAKLVRSFAN